MIETVDLAPDEWELDVAYHEPDIRRLAAGGVTLVFAVYCACGLEWLAGYTAPCGQLHVPMIRPRL